MSINWYPGHMHKASKEMTEVLPQVNLVIELLDARIPYSSSNPFIQTLCVDKPRIKLLSKADLADPQITKVWQDYFESQNNTKSMALDLKNSEIILLEGENGVGKTSLLNMIAGLINPDKGIIKIYRKSIFELGEKRKKNFTYIPDKNCLKEKCFKH